MPAPVFIGDEVSASAYRLGGAKVHTPGDDEIAATLELACREAELVLITAELATRLPADDLIRFQSRVHPLVLIVPDLRGNKPLPDLSRWTRTQLGLES